MRSSKRIKALANLVQNSNVLVDVGCDHGYLMIEALKQGYAKRVIGVDISNGPLSQARLNLSYENLLDKAKLIISDGLINVDDNFDTLVIAGMGGRLIAKIINDSLNKVKDASKIILSAQNDLDYLRKYLFDNGFSITYEKFLESDKKFYIIMLVKFTNEFSDYDNLDLEYGPYLRKNMDKEYRKFLEKRHAFYMNVLNSNLNQENYDLTLEKINSLNEVLK